MIFAALIWKNYFLLYPRYVLHGKKKKKKKLH